jgi:TolB-like protein/DNA-binding winged helix-turn-helix (wHTH) protein/Flp pilus assembly protein TadD
MTLQEQRLYEFGPYRMDVAKRLLLRDGEAVSLTPKCFEILLALVENSGQVVDKEGLMHRVWPDSFVEDGNLTFNISVLRKALGEKTNEHRYIVTVPGRGYRFVAGVSEVSPQAQEEAAGRASSKSGDAYKRGEPPQDDTKLESRAALALRPVAEEAHANTPRRELANKPARVGRRGFVGAAALTMVAIIGVGAYLHYGRSSQSHPSSVAVLPFSNGSGSPDMEYLSDGISESLIDTLSQQPGVKVIARSSSFKYKGKQVDPREVARELGVETILTGRVAQLGDNLLISTELMDARDKTQLWAEQYNRKAPDLLSVQSEISGEIVRKLRLKLTTADQKRLARNETVDPQAYELLLRGRFHMEKYGTEDRVRAVEFFKRAISIDPNYAPLYAELSFAYHSLAGSSILDPKAYLPQAAAAAQKALELDESLAEGHLSLATLRTTAWDWTAAEREFKRAIELNPGYARAHFRYSHYLSVMGQHEQAVAQAQRAAELDPLSPGRGFALFLARRFDEAVDVFQKTLELDPNSEDAHRSLGFIYAAKGMYPEAIASYHLAVKLGDDGLSTQIYLGAAYARAGQREKAQAILKSLQTSKEYVSPGELSVLYAALGEREQAFASLERAYAAHDLQLQYLGCDPAFDALRADPRFKDLIRRVGLPQ